MNTLNLAGFIESQVDDFMNHRISSMGFGVSDMANIAKELRRLHAENERLIAENEAMAKDADRYVWLKCFSNNTGIGIYYFDAEVHDHHDNGEYVFIDEADSIVDKFMEQSK